MPDFQRLAFPIALLTLLGMALYFYTPILLLKPRGAHAWAQTDRLALAYGFQRNHFNLLQPATLTSGCENQVTGVELPLQSYAAALIGTLIGQEATHIVFRCLTLLLSLTGILVLFRYLWQSTGHFMLSFFPGLFLFCAPVYTFYAAGFLPDIAGLAFLILGFVALLRYFETGLFRHTLVVVGWMTIAALVKMSLAFLLLGTMIWLLLDLWWKNRRRAFPFMVLCLLAGGTLIAQYLYIHYLDTKNHCGVFIATPNPPTGRHLWSYFLTILAKYKGVYLSSVQEWIGLAVLISTTGLSILFYKTGKKLIAFTALPLLALLANFLVMGVQMEAHDYYAIAVFFPLIIWITLLFSKFGSTFLKQQSWRKGMNLVMVLVGIVMIPPAGNLVMRHTFGQTADDWIYLPEVNAARKILPPKAHVVVATQTEAPNYGLAYFERVGISTIFDYTRNNEDFFQRVRAGYFIMDKSRLGELAENTPRYHQYLKEFYNGTSILIFEYIE
jgi:hypothetical protein